MHKNRRICYCRSCQNARLDQARPEALPVARTWTVSLELMLAAIGLIGLLAWAWIFSRHL